MQPHVCLLVLVAVLTLAHARSTSIQQISPELEKKLAEVVEEAIKDQKPIENELPLPAENISSEPSLLNQPNPVKDVDNNLRKVPAPEIPVKVIVEDVPSQLKSDSEPAKSDVAGESENVDVKRTEPDLAHPGAPEHQQHETQSPEPILENHILSNIKNAIAETQTTFNEGFSLVTKNVQDFLLKNEQVSNIQGSIQEFQDKFRGQVEKINLSIKSIMFPVSENAVVTEEKEIKLKNALKGAESTIQNLENNFEMGINTISSGIQLLAAGKAESEAEVKPPAQPAQPTQPVQPSQPAPPAFTNPFAPFFNAWSTAVSNGFGNFPNLINPQNQATTGNSTANEGGIFNNFGSFFNGGNQASGPTDGVVADEAANNKTSLLQNLQASIQSLFNPNQPQADTQQPNQPQPNRPFATLQNNIAQGLSSLFQTNRQPAQPAKPAKPAQAAAASKPQAAVDTEAQGSNVVPVKTLEAEAQKPEAAATPEKKPEATELHKPVGPIQQLNQQIQKNPIVRGITGAVQRLQNTITNNPEKPRDAASSLDKTKAAEKGHKPGSEPSVNDSDSDSKRIEQEAKPEPETKPAEPSLAAQTAVETKEVVAEPPKPDVPAVASEPAVADTPSVNTE